MALVSGTLTDFGLGVLAPFEPRLLFKARTPAVSGSSLLSSRRIEVIPASDGSFSVELIPSVETSPETIYTVAIEWLGLGAEFAGFDVLDRLVVPLGGGFIGDMTTIPITRFWAGPTPPPNTAAGQWWLDTSAYPYLMKEWV